MTKKVICSKILIMKMGPVNPKKIRVFLVMTLLFIAFFQARKYFI